MVASLDTISQIVKVVRKYVDQPTFAIILSEFERISGNKSFRETIRKIRIEHEES